MKFFNKSVRTAIAVMVLTTAFFSCEEELTTIGDGVIGGEPFVTNKAEFDVFAYNKKISAVQTNRLPAYQLGVFNDPIYGRTEAQITTQIQLTSPNPTFGSFSQATEDISATDDIDATILENETVDSVFLYIPFLTKNSAIRDQDLDGVDDIFDADPEDPNSDSDGDGLTDNQERLAGSDPLNEDTDGDGIEDADDEVNSKLNAFPRKFELDSIFGDRTMAFNLKVSLSTFFLRDLDPSTNFLEQQEYFSTQEFAPTFISDVLYDNDVTINDEEILIFNQDDESTEDIDESTTVGTRLAPGIRVPLDNTFFQQNILDKEGSSELLSLANFREFLRGLHFSVTPGGEDLLLLLDLSQANITISYTYDSFDESADNMMTKEQRDFQIALLTGGGRDQFGGLNPIAGNAVNTLINEAYPAEITNNLDTGENASRIYLKGGAGAFAEIKLFDEVNGQEIINEIKANNWIINEANLVFYVDRSILDATPGVVEPPRLYLYNAETNEPLYDPQFDISNLANTLAAFPEYDGVLETGTDGKGIKYTVRITNYLNDIIVRDEANATLGLSLTSDIVIDDVSNAMLLGVEGDVPVMSTVNPLGTVLFGSNVQASEESNKLKLEIFYTQTN